jgi:hypothetical protein
MLYQGISADDIAVMVRDVPKPIVSRAPTAYLFFKNTFLPHIVLQKASNLVFLYK